MGTTISSPSVVALPLPLPLPLPARRAPEASYQPVPSHVKLPLDATSRTSRIAHVERWLDRVRVPDPQAALVLDDAARRWAHSGSCTAEHGNVSDFLPEPATYRRTLRRLEVAGLITLTTTRTSHGQPIGRAIVPVVGASMSPAAWREAVLPLSRPAHARAGR